MKAFLEKLGGLNWVMVGFIALFILVAFFLVKSYIPHDGDDVNYRKAKKKAAAEAILVIGGVGAYVLKEGVAFFICFFIAVIGAFWFFTLSDFFNKENQSGS